MPVPYHTQLKHTHTHTHTHIHAGNDCTQGFSPPSIRTAVLSLVDKRLIVLYRDNTGNNDDD